MKRVKIGQPLNALIKLCYRADRSPLLAGPHGVGKSEILEQAAKELGIDYRCRDLSLMEPPDLVGMPRLVGGKTKFLPPAFLPTSGKGLIVFEELNRCASYMRAPCLQLLTARSINDYRLPPGWLPVAVINPAGEEYDVFELDAALLSRFVRVNVKADRDEWLHWAQAHDVHKSVLDYVAADADVFSGADSNPRSWKYVSDMLHAQAEVQTDPEILHVAIEGLVGDKRAAAFLAFIKTRECPLTAVEILSAYDRHRDQFRTWVRDGKVDLVKGSVLAIEKYLQPARDYTEVKNSRPGWKHLGEFLSDLPGDLREEAAAFFSERGYAVPKKKRN